MSLNLTTPPENLKCINLIKHKMPLINVLMSLMLELISIEIMELIGETEIEKIMDMDLKMNVKILAVNATEVHLLFLRKKHRQ